VIVNRVWHHLFGRGLVPTPDNLGVMGEAPTHPELLDWLAKRFIADGWSLKKLIRRIVLSSTYRMASTGDAAAERLDPGDALLHRARLRRLEGEAIRDAVLAVSGGLSPELYGPPVPVHLSAYQTGRGRPESGPVDGAGRRSIYLAVHRNFLSSFLSVFDFPVPMSCAGRRAVSNVPAQALALLNDPFVVERSRAWADRLPATSDGERVDAIFRTALGRPAEEEEKRAATRYVHSGGSWAELCHTVLNMKDFVYLR